VDGAGGGGFGAAPAPGCCCGLNGKRVDCALLIDQTQ